jgi:phosphoribosylformylglycinamidine (FGAM) synthase PurS component
MQSRWGLSYKDAAHRLYMAEVEKFRAQKEAELSIHEVQDQMDKTKMDEIYTEISRIDDRNI